MRGTLSLGLVALPLLLVGGVPLVPAQKAERPPHGQDQMPGPPLSPAEAIKKMKVPDGFTVELVASEPEIVNPVAMTFDERGRIWITESIEYPRRDAGPGRDRVKVLEDTKGNGVYDKITTFAEGLNIPSGIAVGHGGVWVANAPDILFYREGPDGKAAGKPEVVVSGFGRDDTHELPNSLTWGPDGWLYGLNGVFNRSHVRHQGKEFDFTCALFRIHPRTREFQLFAEGTSNPWGIAWDNEGSAFVSACVIDHLWHLTETGYYHRQGGPYPPFTWKIESIVKHKHQKAAYCGLHFFDSDAYPPEYREKLYMGNIHGGCVNSDELTRDGSTYFGKPRPDFLTANDAWFMPVVQKTGPDGCLYVLDWYDRYHCYQDANRDPRGIDRQYGRLYRVRYKDSPRAGTFDLAKESDDQLIKRLQSPNVYFRDLAQRLLCERNTPEVRGKLEHLVLDDSVPRKARIHGLWALVGAGPLAKDFHLKLLAHGDTGFRAWGVRAAGNMGKVDAAVRDKVLSLVRDSSPDVLLQVAIAARKLDGVDTLPVLVDVLTACGDDRLIPHIVWQNLHPLLEPEQGAGRFLELVSKKALLPENLTRLLPRVVERLLGRRNADPSVVVRLFALLTEGKQADPAAACLCLSGLAARVQTGEISADRLKPLTEQVQPLLRKVLEGKADGPLYFDAAVLAATLQDPSGLEVVRKCFAAAGQPEAARLKALHALVAAKDPSSLATSGALLADGKAGSPQFRADVLAALGRLEDARVAEVVLAAFGKMEADFQPKAIDLLTQRTVWSKQLLHAIADKKVPASALNVNHVRKLLGSKDPDIVKQVKAQWGTLREERNPEREKVVAEMRQLLGKTSGDPVAGIKVFKNVCAQCHKIHGEGQDVGPDLTANGRSSFDQLLSNVFDPSLVIGAGYQATTVQTTKGRVLTGLVVEDSPGRVVLKEQGGKLQVVPRAEIDEISVSKVSLMPEGLEKQMKSQEIADLFAFLCLDKPPSDPTAKKIPGTPKVP
jgi:putative membrane-bound dehydrogenase-like protein